MKRETVEGYIRAQFEDATDEQVKAVLDAVMSDNGKDINKYKSQIDSYTEELEELRPIKEEFEKLKIETMSDEEKRKAAEEKTLKLQEELLIKSNRIDVERMFVEAGVAKDDYEGILDSIVTSDNKASKASAELMVSLINKTREATDKSVRASLLDNTPPPEGSAAKGENVTKEQFDSMSYAQRAQLYETSPELYKSLNQGEN